MEEEIMKGFAAPVQNPQEINPKAMKFSVYIMEGFWEEFP